MKTPRHGLAVLAIGNTIYTVDGAGAPGHTDSVPTNEAIDLS
jgi:non-specific serine/threonine protein kinase